MNEDFQYFVQEYGLPSRVQPIDRATLATYRDRLPISLLEFWEECGLGQWADGRFQFCDPSKYRSIVDLALAGDPIFAPDRTHAYGYTAFGELWLWNEDWQDLTLTLPRLWAAASSTDPDWIPSDPNIAIAAAFSGLGEPATGNWREDSDTAPLLFAKCRKAYGTLQMGEVYGFAPALELGGVATVEYVQRVSALEHFAIIAQLGAFRLFDYSSGRQTLVRELGAG